ncbi:MAG: hypothetical protein ACREV8_12785 [Gammaproteobacteria bacterium]
MSRDAKGVKSLYENAGAHTVQQHLKRAFETGVRSRRDPGGEGVLHGLR